MLYAVHVEACRSTKPNPFRPWKTLNAWVSCTAVHACKLGLSCNVTLRQRHFWFRLGSQLATQTSPAIALSWKRREWREVLWSDPVKTGLHLEFWRGVWNSHRDGRDVSALPVSEEVCRKCDVNQILVKLELPLCFLMLHLTQPIRSISSTQWFNPYFCLCNWSMQSNLSNSFELLLPLVNTVQYQVILFYSKKSIVETEKQNKHRELRTPHLLHNTLNKQHVQHATGKTKRVASRIFGSFLQWLYLQSLTSTGEVCSSIPGRRYDGSMREVYLNTCISFIPFIPFISCAWPWAACRRFGHCRHRSAQEYLLSPVVRSVSCLPGKLAMHNTSEIELLKTAAT